MKYYVYILTSSNNKVLYTGITDNLSRRVNEHRDGLYDGFTKKYKVHKLIYFETTQNVKAALAREKQIKKWSRVKKENLINSVNPEWVEIIP